MARESKAAQEGVMARLTFKSVVTGDSLLPVILKLSASCTGEVLLNTGLLDGPWLKLISSILRSVQFASGALRRTRWNGSDLSVAREHSTGPPAACLCLGNLRVCSQGAWDFRLSRVYPKGKSITD